jgi:hypothetical protein
MRYRDNTSRRPADGVSATCRNGSGTTSVAWAGLESDSGKDSLQRITKRRRITRPRIHQEEASVTWQELGRDQPPGRQ